jgi:hypothetical protein
MAASAALGAGARGAWKRGGRGLSLTEEVEEEEEPLLRSSLLLSLSELLVRESVLGGLGVAAAVDGGGILFSFRGVVGGSGWDDRRLGVSLGLATAAGDEDGAALLRRGSFMAEMHFDVAPGTGFSMLRGICCKNMSED